MTLSVQSIFYAVIFLLHIVFYQPLMAETILDYRSKGYMGAHVGASTTNIDEAKIVQNVLDVSYTDKERDLGYKFFGGYNFNDYVALEGGYFHLGTFEYTLFASSGNLDKHITFMGLNLDAITTLPISENLVVFGRLGVHYTQAKDTYSAAQSISMEQTVPENYTWSYKLGAGVAYDITPTIGMRFEVERYSVHDTVGNVGDVDYYSMGVTYRFGTTKEEVLVVVMEPQAEVKIKEASGKTQTVVLVLEDIYFAFDNDTLSTVAKDTLKRTFSVLKMKPTLRVLVAGFTSESGSATYNQRLSERRARAVKAYLIKEKLIPKEKISIIGHGQTKPIRLETNSTNIHSKAAQANMRVFLKITYQ